MSVTINLSKPAAHLIDHIALGMPTFVVVFPVDLRVLLGNGTVTSRTFRGKTSGVMELTIDVDFMLVMRVLRTEDSSANGARKMLNVLFCA